MMMRLGLVLRGEGEGGVGCLRDFHREEGGEVILVMMLDFSLLGDNVAGAGGDLVCHTGEGDMVIWTKKNLGLGPPGEGEVVVEGSQVYHAEEAGEVI